MKLDYFKVLIAYLAASVIAVICGNLLVGWNPILVVGIADLAGTLVVFGFSVYFDNSSLYDPYWSVAPILITFYWLFSGTDTPVSQLRRMVVAGLVLVWAVRLTMNWAVRWQGIKHEDWRYASYRSDNKQLYWLISFFGFHLMPTIIVFLGCLPLIPSLSTSQTPFGTLDLGAFIITSMAILIETKADLDITRFLSAGNKRSSLLQSGLWSLSRHPNYLGEILFWWGLFVFALSADRNFWWTVIGPISITILFLTISIPLIEKHHLTKRSEYSDYQNTTSMLVPWWKRNP